jgi:hypothetical protein
MNHIRRNLGIHHLSRLHQSLRHPSLRQTSLQESATDRKLPPPQMKNVA